MGNKIKDINIKDNPCYFFGDVINIKHFDVIKIKRDEKSYKIILLDWICDNQRFEIYKN